MNLLPKIADPENLRLAFLKASRGKRGKREVIRFRERLGEELSTLRHEILSQACTLGDYRYFTVFDPKERVICAAAFRERVLHHAIMNVCEPVLERAAIFDSYACRTGKGQFACLNRAQRYARGRNYYLKLDVRKYFDNIHHGTLLCQLERRFPDIGLLTLFERLLQTYETTPGKGLPIGNLCSQHFANHYLGRLDRFVKEELRCRAYVRYMDDFVLWHDSRDWLCQSAEKIAAVAQEGLRLELKPPLRGDCRKGMNLLGFRVFPFRVQLSGRSRRRFLRRWRALTANLKCGCLTEDEAAGRYAALEAFAGHAKIDGLRRVALRRFGSGDHRL